LSGIYGYNETLLDFNTGSPKSRETFWGNNTGSPKSHETFWGKKDWSAGLRLLLSLFIDADSPINDRKIIPFKNTASASRINEQAGRLLNEYGNSVLRLAYSYMHNLSDAEDVLQDALIQFIKTAPEFGTAAHEKAWLMRVAINISKNKIKYMNVRKADELHENLTANEQDDLVFVWDAVKSLPPVYSEVVHLFYHEGYSTAHIAGLLSKNESTVRSLLKRARERLKAVLKEAYDFE
jgi:RNA polymerase sigma factor (sigma-70 family)